jgi:nicotinamidase-related amidase
MNLPLTLLQMAGVQPAAVSISDATVLVIDAQNEYLDGALPLPGAAVALQRIGALLERARRLGARVVHVKHRGRTGGLFDPDAPGGQIARMVAPAPGELVVEKSLPNAFAGTELHKGLATAATKKLIVAGFMTHLCVSSTIRAALDLGYSCAVVDAATASRDLPAATGISIVSARDVHRATLAALADRFATVVADIDDLVD